MNEERYKAVRDHLKYQNLFWLFMVANVVGVLMEGVWTVIKFGRWESHVVTVWGPFCLLYGTGAVVFYLVSALVGNRMKWIQFLAFAFFADIVEYMCAWMIDAGLGMKAWTYKKHFMNLYGRISLSMTLVWGVTGMLFYYLLIPRIIRMFQRMQGKFFSYTCVLLTAFMIVNMAVTTLCLVRWSRRHAGMEANNAIEVYIDQKYNDAFMKRRFCEWWFIDEAKEFWQVYKRK